ncbi:hypothetical protein VTI74DRAFT_9298 [Chaetomium olivicolor]
MAHNCASVARINVRPRASLCSFGVTGAWLELEPTRPVCRDGQLSQSAAQKCGMQDAVGTGTHRSIRSAAYGVNTPFDACSQVHSDMLMDAAAASERYRPLGIEPFCLYKGSPDTAYSPRNRSQILVPFGNHGGAPTQPAQGPLRSPQSHIHGS